MEKNTKVARKKRTPTFFWNLKWDFKHGTSTIHMEVKNELKFLFLNILSAIAVPKCSFLLWRTSFPRFYNSPSTKINDTSWDKHINKTIDQKTDQFLARTFKFLLNNFSPFVKRRLPGDSFVIFSSAIVGGHDSNHLKGSRKFTIPERSQRIARQVLFHSWHPEKSGYVYVYIYICIIMLLDFSWCFPGLPIQPNSPQTAGSSTPINHHPDRRIEANEASASQKQELKNRLTAFSQASLERCVGFGRLVWGFQERWESPSKITGFLEAGVLWP